MRVLNGETEFVRNAEDAFWRMVADMAWAAPSLDAATISSQAVDAVVAAYGPQQAVEVAESMCGVFHAVVYRIAYALNRMPEFEQRKAPARFIYRIVGRGPAVAAAVAGGSRDAALRCWLEYDANQEASFADCFEGLFRLAEG